ncbi:hypothetical protein GQ457_03G011100 [Hibiscus cannabinus]
MKRSKREKITQGKTISASTDLGELSSGQVIHAWGYSEHGDIEASKSVLKEMVVRDVVSWNAMISCYSRNMYSKEAQSLFKKLIHRCLQLSFSTVLVVISSCIPPIFSSVWKINH